LDAELQGFLDEPEVMAAFAPMKPNQVPAVSWRPVPSRPISGVFANQHRCRLGGRRPVRRVFSQGSFVEPSIGRSGIALPNPEDPA